MKLYHVIYSGVLGIDKQMLVDVMCKKLDERIEPDTKIMYRKVFSSTLTTQMTWKKWSTLLMISRSRLLIIST